MNQPLTPAEQAKVFFFFALQIALIGVVGIGAILSLTTLWGLVLLHRTHSFSYIDTLRHIHKGYAGIASIILTAFSTHLLFNWLDQENVILLGLSLLIYPVYALLVDWLFYNPLSKHKGWVVTNGIFATSIVEAKEPRTVPLISFGKSYSTADELLKLSKLREANLLTAEEFSALRKKLFS